MKEAEETNGQGIRDHKIEAGSGKEK